MTLHDDTAIERLALGVIDLSLPKAEWTHAGHFAFAIWLTRHRTHLTKPDAIRRLITRYNEATGTENTDTSGYHHTITLASIGAAAYFLRRDAAEAPLARILSALMGSKCGGSDWLLEHWKRETLFSIKARKSWVAPDLAALPF